MRGGESAEAQQCERDRDSRALGEVAHFFHGAGDDDAVAGEDDGPLGVMDQFESLLVFLRVGRQIGTVAGQLRLGGVPVEFAGGLLRIFRDVDQHRARAAGAGDVEGFANCAGHFVGVGHEVIVLGDGQGDAGDVGFLKGVGADELAAHLAGDAHDGRGIEHGGGDAGDHVGGARSGGSDGDADFTAGARIAIGHVRGALFVTHQDVVNLAVLQGVVGGEDGAAGIAEHVRDVFALQAFPENLRAGLGHGCSSLRGYSSTSRRAGPLRSTQGRVPVAPLVQSSLKV